MTREMVRVELCEDGTYKVEEADRHHVTQRLWGTRNGKSLFIYYCPKAEWKKYLLKLATTKQIDEKIEYLKQRKKRIEALKVKLEKELGE